MNCFRKDYDYYVSKSQFLDNLFYFGKDDMDNENKDYL